MTEDQHVSLQAWVDTLTDRLDTGYEVDEESMHIILDLARDAAHEVARPAAPLTTFLVGVAVGRGTSLGAAAARATELALAQEGDAGDAAQQD
ncbi:MAG: DUF6457 domain-containing protein [Propionibacteriaceae bacterium]|nr:DUF6457 domain-containing protein [Propionibacteriaceae bacterium]